MTVCVGLKNCHHYTSDMSISAPFIFSEEPSQCSPHALWCQQQFSMIRIWSQAKSPRWSLRMLCNSSANPPPSYQNWLNRQRISLKLRMWGGIPSVISHLLGLSKVLCTKLCQDPFSQEEIGAVDGLAWRAVYITFLTFNFHRPCADLLSSI